MASIYDIPNWHNATAYVKNDIVRHAIAGQVGPVASWYALQDVPVNQAPAVASSYWGGWLTAPTSSHANATDVTAPNFIWAPAYNVNVTHAPKVQAIQFGDGYEQRMEDGIFNQLLLISLTFDGRTSKESAAILHFLRARNGVESFFFTPPSPYNARRKYVCSTFSDVIVSQDNVNVTAAFRQVP